MHNWNATGLPATLAIVSLRDTRIALQEAVKACELALRADAASVKAAIRKAQCLEALGQINEAFAAYERALLMHLPDSLAR